MSDQPMTRLGFTVTFTVDLEPGDARTVAEIEKLFHEELRHRTLRDLLDAYPRDLDYTIETGSLHFVPNVDDLPEAITCRTYAEFARAKEAAAASQLTEVLWNVADTYGRDWQAFYRGEHVGQTSSRETAQYLVARRAQDARLTAWQDEEEVPER